MKTEEKYFINSVYYFYYYFIPSVRDGVGRFLRPDKRDSVGRKAFNNAPKSPSGNTALTTPTPLKFVKDIRHISI